MVKPWYNEGLRFKCTQCGQCCTGSPGNVWVDEKEIAAMADFLNISVEEFRQKYTHKVGNRISLIEDAKNFDCVFLKDGLCRVYKARPKQCSAFPWWKENLKSPKHWEETAARCEGINHPDAPLISLGDIEKKLI